MLSPKFLEAMNGTLFILLVFACFMFGVYVLREVLSNGFQRTRLQAAVSISVFIFGEGTIRGWVWYWQHLSNAGVNAGWMENHPVLFAGAVIQVLGIVCVIRVFAPDSWGRNIWFVSAMVAAGVATAFMYL